MTQPKPDVYEVPMSTGERGWSALLTENVRQQSMVRPSAPGAGVHGWGVNSSG